jgi:hypothetical protein
MSYDVRLTADLGGPEPIVVGEWNHNYVYKTVWRPPICICLPWT